MHPSLSRPVLTRAMAAGLLAVSVVGLPGSVAQSAAADALPAYRVVPGVVLRPKPPAVVLPVHGYRLTGRFGDHSGLWSSMHTGLDFAAPSGTSIHSVTSGVVTSAGYDGSFGYKTVVRLTDGIELWYCHQDVQLVRVGERVQAGEVIGVIGSTGNVTGPHLHLEVRQRTDHPVDPLRWLRTHGLRP